MNQLSKPPVRLTEEHVGRVVVANDLTSWKIVAKSIDGSFIIGRDHIYESVTPDGYAVRTNCVLSIREIKPEKLWAKKNWWNVHKIEGEYVGRLCASYRESQELMGDPVATVYDVFWVGYNEGDFHEPGKNGVPIDA